MLNKLTTRVSGIALLCISLNLFSQEKKEIKLENYFGDLSARQIGPAVMSGRISDMENHPTDPMILYAGSAGGVYGNQMMREQLFTQFLMIMHNPLELSS